MVEECCKNCLFSIDYGESVQFIKCAKNRKYVDKKDCCKYFAEESDR